MRDGITAAGVTECLYAGDQISHLASGKGFHGNTLQLKNTDLFDSVSRPVGFENDGIAWLYLSMEDAQMNNSAAIGIIMRVKNQCLQRLIDVTFWWW